MTTIPKFLHSRACRLVGRLAVILLVGSAGSLSLMAQTVISGTYTGQTINDSVTVPTGSATFTGNSTYTGPNQSIGNSAGFVWQQVGTLSGKTITLGNSAFFHVSGANNAVTFDTGTTLALGTGAYLYLNGTNNAFTFAAGTSITGPVSVYSSGSAGTTITNQGTFNHTGGTGNIYASLFTNDGAINATAGTLYLNYPSAGYNAVNNGTVTADGAGTTVYLRGNFDNNGTLMATNGATLHWDGSNTSANLGGVVLAGTGSRALLQGTIDNTAAALPTVSGGVFELLGGTVVNGTIDAGTLAFTGSGGTLNNVSYTGDLVLGNSTSATFTNGANYTGSNLTLGSSAGLQWAQGGTFSGQTITLGNSAYFYVSNSGNAVTFDAGTTLDLDSSAYLYLNGANNSFTFEAGTTVNGTVAIYSNGSVGTAITNQGTFNHTGGSASIYASLFTNDGAINATGGTLYLNYPSAGYNALNTGTVTADGATVYLRGNFDNDGTVTAANGGILRWDGSNTSANLGNVVLTGTGSRALLQGTIDNTAGALPTVSGGTFELLGGTILNGTINAGTLAFTGSGGTLNNVSYAGDLAIGASTSATFTNGANYTGSNLTLGSSAGLFWSQGGTFSDQTITLANSAYFYLNGSGNTVTFDTGTTLALGTGAYLHLNGVNNAFVFDPTTTVDGTVFIYTNGSVGTTITNQGAFNHTGGTGQVYATSFTNTGAINATAGTLYLNYPGAGYNATNTGTVTADGPSTNLYLRGNFDNDGTVTATNGAILRWDGSNTSTNLGNVVLTGTGSRALLQGTIDNTASALPTVSGGMFELLGGTILNGTINAGTLTFTSSGGTLNNVSYAGDLALSSSTSATFTNGANYTGSNLTLGSSAGLHWTQGGTFSDQTITLANSSYFYLNGSGNTVTFDAGTTISLGSGAYLYLNGVNNAFTFANGTTVSGTVAIYSNGSAGTSITNQGVFNHTGGSASIYASDFTNAGAINATAGTLYLNYPGAGYNATNTGSVTADGASTNVYLRGNFDNDGTVTATNGAIVRWDGSNTSANLGNVVLTGAGSRALLQGTIDNTASALPTVSGGMFELLGGMILNGTINAGTLAFTSSGGTLNNVSYTGDLSIGASTSATFTNGANYTGSNLTLGSSAGLHWTQGGTFSDQAITLANSAYFYLNGTGNMVTFDAGTTLALGTSAYLYLNGVNNAFTFAPGTTVSGNVSIYSNGSAGTSITNEGAFNHTGGTGQVYASNFTNAGAINAAAGTLYLGYSSAGYNTTNAGTVTADGAGTTLYLRGTFDNNGTVTASNGAWLRWDGSNTSTNLGNVVLTGAGSRAMLQGTIDNTASVLPTVSGGLFELVGGTIFNGMVNAGTLGFSSSGGTLNNVSYAGDLAIGASTSVTFTNGANYTGSNLTLGNNAGLHWTQGGTFSGQTITLGGSAYFYLSGTGNAATFDAGTTIGLGSGAYLYLNGVNNAFTFANGTTVSGSVAIYSNGSAGTSITNQGVFNHTGGSASIYASDFTNAGAINATAGTLYLNYPGAGYNATNTGSVAADGAGTNVYVRGNFDNDGTVTAANGAILRWDGSNTSANLGTVVLTGTGSRVLLQGMIDNTASVLPTVSGGLFELLGGTINEGVINAGTLGFTSSGGTLSHVSYTGDLTLGPSTSVNFINDTEFTGTNAVIANGATLNWQQDGLLAGKQLTMGAGTSYGTVTVAANRQLTLDSASSVTGVFNVNGQTSSTITNYGAVTATGSGTSYLYGPSLHNHGTIAALSGSTLYLGYNSNQATTNHAGGVVQNNGGIIRVYTPLQNLGTIIVQSGTLYTNDFLTNAAGGVIGGAGTIIGDLTIAGGTLAPGNSVGTLTLSTGDFFVTGSSTLEIEVDGAFSDKVTFLSPGTIDLGSGLLSLSLNLLSAPAPDSSYTIMAIASGGSGFNGKFVGLANSGDWLTANYAGTDYSFQITYLPNSILLAVPEPGTYALMGLGVLLVALRRRFTRR